MKNQINFRAHDLTTQQIDDLIRWWNATQTDVISECISRAWHDEAARRSTGEAAPWRVQPGDKFFTDRHAAVSWLESQGAEQRTGDEWHSAETETWYTLEQIKFEKERKMEIKEREASLVTVSKCTSIEDAVTKIASIREDQAYIFDDNGSDPDGPSWIVPEDDLDSDVIQKLTWSGELLVALGDIIEYDGNDKQRATLDATYPGGWCGFSNRDEAYCLQTARPTDFDWSETEEWLRNNPDANPGGHDDGADLFEAPLPEGFKDANSIFLDGEEWGWDGSAETGGWEIGKSSWIVRPEDAEIWNLFE